jgi:hypothetical protein
MAVIAFLCATELHWRFFKWLVINHITRVAKLNNLEGLVYIYVMGLEFNFREAIFDKYGFFKSFKYAFDLDAQKLEKEIHSNRIEPGFRLPMDKQIVMNEDGCILLDGKYVGKWSDTLRVDSSGYLRHLGTRTEYVLDNVTNTVYLQDVVKNITKPVGKIERINYAWTLITLSPH